MRRQGEGGGLKILKNEETSFMDDPLGITSRLKSQPEFLWNAEKTLRKASTLSIPKKLKMKSKKPKKIWITGS